MPDSPNNSFLIVLGSISLLSDIIVIGQFSLTGNILKFWTFQWTITIFFILLLLGIGMFFLFLGGEERFVESVLIVFGKIYISLAIIIYFYFGFNQLVTKNEVSEYFGFITLLGIFSFIGVLNLRYFKDLLLIPSYGFAISNLAYVLLMGYKYVFKGDPFICTSFVSEIFILILGAMLFLGLYLLSMKRTRR